MVIMLINFWYLLKHGTLNNLWDMHPPFQIDGNFGGTWLLRRNAACKVTWGFIHLLPVCPMLEWRFCVRTLCPWKFFIGCMLERWKPRQVDIISYVETPAYWDIGTPVLIFKTQKVKAIVTYQNGCLIWINDRFFVRIVKFMNFFPGWKWM